MWPYIKLLPLLLSFSQVQKRAVGFALLAELRAMRAGEVGSKEDLKVKPIGRLIISSLQWSPTSQERRESLPSGWNLRSAILPRYG